MKTFGGVSLDEVVGLVKMDFEWELLNAELLILAVVANSKRRLRERTLFNTMRKLAERHEAFHWFKHAEFDMVKDLIENPLFLPDVYDLEAVGRPGNWYVSLNEQGRELYEQLLARFPERVRELVDVIEEVVGGDGRGHE